MVYNQVTFYGFSHIYRNVPRLFHVIMNSRIGQVFPEAFRRDQSYCCYMLMTSANMFIEERVTFTLTTNYSVVAVVLYINYEITCRNVCQI